jgi:glycosyltransferase involved in cell wall biosynthesis
MMIKVSIIVPIYNVERYLERCLDSLVNQTLNAIEIILINDASPDNSELIMEKYRRENTDKIKCIYLKENVKQGGARNVGIKAASGDFILFVDGDDWIAVDMCEKLYSAAVNEGSDLVICDMLKVYEKTGEKKYLMEAGTEISGVLTEEKQKLAISLSAFPVCRLISRSILIDNALFFAENIKYEDLAVVPLYPLYAKKMSKINEALYFYNIREDSTTQEKNNTHHFERMESAMILLNSAKKRGFYEKYREEFDYIFSVRYCFYMLRKCVDKFDDPPIEKMREISININRLCPNYLNNYYIKKISEPKFLRMASLNDIGPEVLHAWYIKKENETYDYKDFYEETHGRAQALLEYCRQKGYNIALWGAGLKGNEFLRVNDNNKVIRYVIDSNPDKKGSILLTGHKICAFDEIKDDIDVILVSNKKYFGDVYFQVQQKEQRLKVLNLDMLLTFKIDIEDYFR